VPITSVTVPPDFPLDDELVDALVDDDVELDDELPHALSANAVAPVRSKASNDLECLCTTPPPVSEVSFPLSAI
jgi:hypothetical protein